MMKMAKKDLDHRRRSFAFKQNEFVTATMLTTSIETVLKVDPDLEDTDNESLVSSSAAGIRRLSTVEPGFFEPLVPIINVHCTIDGFLDEGRLRFLCRFETKADLHRLRVGFHFPDKMLGQGGKAFSGEEILMAGLFRLSHTNSVGGHGFGCLHYAQGLGCHVQASNQHSFSMPRT